MLRKILTNIDDNKDFVYIKMIAILCTAKC